MFKRLNNIYAVFVVKTNPGYATDHHHQHWRHYLCAQNEQTLSRDAHSMCTQFCAVRKWLRWVEKRCVKSHTLR